MALLPSKLNLGMLVENLVVISNLFPVVMTPARMTPAFRRSLTPGCYVSCWWRVWFPSTKNQSSVFPGDDCIPLNLVPLSVVVSDTFGLFVEHGD